MENTNTNFVSADLIVDEVLGDTYDDSGILREKCYKWLFRVWKQITQDFIEDVKRVILPVSPLTKTVQLPVDYDDYITVGYVDCGNIRHLNINPNLAPANIVDERACKKCGEIDLCSLGYETIEEEVFIDEVPEYHVSPSFYCLNTSAYYEYNMYFSRIYKPGFSNNSIAMKVAPASDVYAEMDTRKQWKNWLDLYPTNTTGPANRCGVWTADCSTGQIAPPTKGTQVTIEMKYQNDTGARRVYVGCFGDNEFTLRVNEVEIAKTNYQWRNTENMRIFHIFPVEIKEGLNRFNIIGQGAGGPADALGMIVYDNTAEELKAATSDDQLKILLTTDSLKYSKNGGAPASYGCAEGWELVLLKDGTYACRCTTAPKSTGKFKKTIQRRINSDGSYVEEVKEPVVIYNEFGMVTEIQQQTSVRTICELERSPCGCISATNANISTLLQNGCCHLECCNTKNLPMGFNSSCMGTVMVFGKEGFIQLSHDSPLESVYLAYKTNALTRDGIFYFPEECEEALIAGSYFRSIEKKANVPANEKERARKAFNTQLTHMQRRMSRQSLQDLINIFEQRPRFARK